MRQLRGEDPLERASLRSRVLGCTSASHEDAVGPHRFQAAQAELTGLQQTIVDLQVEDPPIEPANRCDPVTKKELVIVILGLKVMLADEEPFTPNRLSRHRLGPDRGNTDAKEPSLYTTATAGESAGRLRPDPPKLASGLATGAR